MSPTERDVYVEPTLASSLAVDDRLVRNGYIYRVCDVDRRRRLDDRVRLTIFHPALAPLSRDVFYRRDSRVYVVIPDIFVPDNSSMPTRTVFA